MLDERWSADVEEIASALRRLLEKESSPERVRAAEARADKKDPDLEAQLERFGLTELSGSPELFSRIAYELGRSLACTGFVETMPILALLGRSGVALAHRGLAPAASAQVAVFRDSGVYVEPLVGQERETAAGDTLVEHEAAGECECVGGPELADRLARYANLVEAARMVGAGQALLSYVCDYAKERVQFGKIIGSYQGVAHRLARAAGQLDAAELLVRKSAFSALNEAGGDGAPAAAFALMVRAKAVEAARTVATEAHQVFGGNGFAMEYNVQLFSRRLRSWAQRGPRPGQQLAELGSMVLDPGRRDAIQLLWHYQTGMPLPRWAAQADSQSRPHDGQMGE